MNRKLILLWFERDVRFRSSMTRLLEHYARKRRVELVVRTATTAKQAASRLDAAVSCLLCDVSANGAGMRTGLSFLESARTTAPMLVLTDEIDLPTCARLLALRATTLVKRRALTHARVLADIIIAEARSGPAVARTSVTYREHCGAFDEDVARTFEKHGRNVSAGARAIGMKRTTFQSRLRKLGLR